MNTIIQDVNKVSSGIRTISLRIASSEIAKQQLDELGEDTTDYVVQTTAKLQQKIKDLTKTEFNKEGVNIVDPNGSLKSTYDILLEISKVYKDIQEDDKKNGSNRASALVELLAGKNRSNIAASILLNPDTLEDVYNQASNANGSAQQELDKYLDSITAKLAQFTNQIHEFWNGLISSDVIKFFIDLGNHAMNLVNTFGSIQSTLVAISFILGTKKLNIFNTVIGKDGFRNITVFGKALSDLKDTYNSFKAEGNGSIKSFFKLFQLNSKYIVPDDIFKQYQNIRTKAESLMASNNGLDVSTAVQQASHDLGYSLNITGDVLDRFSDESKSAIVSADGLAESFKRTSGAGKKFNNFLTLSKSLLGNLATGALSALIGLGITQLVKVIDNAIHDAEITAEKAKSAFEEFNSLSKTISSNRESIGKLSKQFEALSSGVDYAGNNVSLTTTEFDEYHEITSKIADMFPSMVKGFDAQGNAILNTTGKVKDLTTALQEEQKEANNVLINNSGDIVKDYRNDQKKITGNLYNSGITANEYLDLVDELFLIINNNLSNNKDKINTLLSDRINSFANDNNVDINDLLDSLAKDFALNNDFDRDPEHNGLIFSFEDAFERFENSIIKVRAQTDTYRSEANENLSNLNKLFIATFQNALYLNDKNEFNSIVYNENAQKILEGLFSGITEDTVANLFLNNVSPVTFVDNVMKSFASALSGSHSEELSSAFEQLINGAIVDSQGNINDDYSPTEAVNLMEEIKSSILTSLISSDMDENEKQAITNSIDGLLDFYGASVTKRAEEQYRTTLDSIFSLFDDLSYNEFQENMPKLNDFFKEYDINTAEEFVNFFAELENIVTSAEENGTIDLFSALDQWAENRLKKMQGEVPKLSSFLTDESSKKKVDNTVALWEKLGNAIDNFYTMSASDKFDLYETLAGSFPDIVNGGELTIDMLDRLINEQWKQLETTLSEVEGAEGLLAVLRALRDEALNSSNAFNISRQVNGFSVDGLSERDQNYQYILKEQYEQLTEYTKDFGIYQKKVWAKVTADATSATEAIQMYEDYMSSKKFTSLEQLLADEDASNYINLYKNNIALIEKGIDNIYSLTGDERNSLVDVFPWLAEEGVNETSLTKIKEQFDVMLEALGVDVAGFDEYIKNIYNSAVNAEKSIATRYAEINKAYNDKPNFSYDENGNIIGEVSKNPPKAGDILNPEIISNAEKSLIVKYYDRMADGEKDFEKAVENSTTAIGEFLTVSDMLNDSDFSEARSEYESLLSMISDGLDEEERHSFFETYGFEANDYNIKLIKESLRRVIEAYANAAGEAGKAWLEQQDKYWGEQNNSSIRNTLLKRVDALNLGGKYNLPNSIDDWLRGLSNEDLSLALTLDIDENASLDEVKADFERLKHRIDTEKLLNLSIYVDGEETTFGSYMDTVKSEAETIKQVIHSLTNDSEHGGKLWEDIEKDYDTYNKLNQIIPDLSAYMNQFADSDDQTSIAISFLTEKLTGLNQKFAENTSGLAHMEGMTDDARAAFYDFLNIMTDITTYDIKGSLKDVADQLDKIYFDRAGDEARSFTQAISDVESEINTLHDAYTTLMSVDIKEDSVEFTSLVNTLLQQFPELIGHTDNIYELRNAVAALLNEKSDSLILRLRELAAEEGIPDELRGKIDALINSFYNLGNQPFSMDHTMNVLKDVRGEMNQLAEFINKVNTTGLHLDMSGSDDVFNYFPQLLENAKIYGDGTIELNKEIYDNFIKTREAELKGDIDAKVKELENDNVVLQSKIQYYEQRVKAAKAALDSENVADMESTLFKLENADAVLENAADNDKSQVEAYVEAAKSIAGNDAEITEYQIENDNLVTDTKQDNDIAEVASDDAATIAKEENIVDENGVFTESLENESENFAAATTGMLDDSASASEGMQQNIGYVNDAAYDTANATIKYSADASEKSQQNGINASTVLQNALTWVGQKANLAAEAWRKIGTEEAATDMGGTIIGNITGAIRNFGENFLNFRQRVINAARGEVEKNAQAELKSFKDTFVGKVFSSVGDVIDGIKHSVNVADVKKDTQANRLKNPNIKRDPNLAVDLDSEIIYGTDKYAEEIEQRFNEAKTRLEEVIETDTNSLNDLRNTLAKNLYQIELLKANGGINVQDIANRLAADNAKDSGGSGGGSDRTPSEGSGGSGGSDATENANEFSEVIDWIEVKIQRLEEEIARLDKVIGNSFQKYKTRADAIMDNINNVNDEIAVTRAAYWRYMTEAENIPLSDYYKKLVRKGAIDIENIQDEELSNSIKSYTEWYNKAVSMQDSLYDLCMDISNLYQEAFDLIQNRADSVLTSFENASNLINSAINRTEQKGYLVSQKYYEKLIDNAETQMFILNKKHEEMLTMFQEAVDTGAVEEGSEAWYNYKNQVDQVTIAIDEMTNSIIEYNNAIRQLQWDKFDLTQTMIGDITSEADFLINLMSNFKMYSDQGYITNRGMGTKGLHGLNYNVYMQQADEYRDEMLKISEDLAKDPNNKTLYERRKQLLELQQEMILAAEQEKQALKSLVEQGIQSTLSYLKELIDTYSNALDQQKSLYDYQKNVANQTKNITNIQKQLAALSGDDSEENRKRLQELNNSLETAQESLQETLYERAISDQKELLNGLYDDFNTVLNERLDNLDVLIAEQIGEINLASGQISDTINTVAGNVGYQVTSGVNEVFASSDFNSLPALATYTSELMTELSNDRAIITETLTNGQTSTLENISTHAGLIEGYLTAVASALGYDGQTAASLIGDSVYGITLNAEKIDNIAKLLGTGDGNLSENIHNAFSEDLSVINSALSGEQSIQNLINTMASTLQRALIGESGSVGTSINNIGTALDAYLGNGDTNAIKRSFDENSTAIQDQINGVKNKIQEMDKASNILAAIDMGTGKVGDVINNMGSVKDDLDKIRELMEKLFETKTGTPSSSNVKANANSAAAKGNGTYTKADVSNLTPVKSNTGSGNGSGSVGVGAKAAVNSAKNTSQGNGKPEVGDIVTFTGQYNYSAWGVKPVGSQFSGQPNAVEIYQTATNYAGVSKPYRIRKAGTKPGDPWSDLGWVSLDQLKGYWTGTQSVDKDRFALVNERGTETIVRPDGSILTPLARQSMVVDAQATDNMWRMLKDPEKFMSTVLKDTNIVNTNNGGDINNDISITIPISNVSDFEDLMRQIQSSDKWERMFDAMLNNRLKGTSRFDKYNVKF